VHVIIWGCRGSLASPGRSTVRYGGNTSCIEVRHEGGSVVLDAGTGLRPLGEHIAAEAPPRIDLLLTHLHLDHLEGLGFFLPLWRVDSELHIWGPPSPTRTLEERIGRYLSPPLFPIDVSDVPARLVFHDVPEEAWDLAGMRISAAPVSHPGPTLGYRLECDEGSIAYIPDHEPALAANLKTIEPEWIPGFALAEGVDVLFHDAQFTDAEYPDRVGWGHSSVTDAVTFARRAEVKRLVLFHHDPWHGDGQLDEIEDRAQVLWNGAGEQLSRVPVA
jgi:phosphoribosyl 1,2-cyclic phosphodiesterase